MFRVWGLGGVGGVGSRIIAIQDLGLAGLIVADCAV